MCDRTRQRTLTLHQGLKYALIRHNALIAHTPRFAPARVTVIVTCMRIRRHRGVNRHESMMFTLFLRRRQMPFAVPVRAPTCPGFLLSTRYSEAYAAWCSPCTGISVLAFVPLPRPDVRLRWGECATRLVCYL